MRGSVMAAVLLLAGCGGGGDGAEPLTKAARFQAASYATATQRTAADLEGTWIAFADGRLSQGDTMIVNGRNYREDYRLWARAVVRFRKKPNDPTRYFVYTCGPSGGRDTDSYHPTPSTIYVPFYYYGTGSWSSYEMTIIDPVTIEGTMQRDWGWVGNSGWAMSWDLDWVLKRISDDPFHAVGMVTDVATGEATAAGCFFEADGAYVATENDDTRQNFRREGRYRQADVYRESALDSDAYSYSARAALHVLGGFRSRYGRNWCCETMFDTANGDEVSWVVDEDGAAAGYAVQATSASGGIPQASDRLQLAP